MSVSLRDWATGRLGDGYTRTRGECYDADRERRENEKSAWRFIDGHFESPSRVASSDSLPKIGRANP